MGLRRVGRQLLIGSRGAVDLQDGLDVASASMGDYARRVGEVAATLPQPVALCGWSMDGLVVLQSADAVSPQSVILIEASPPGEVQGFDPGSSPSLGSSTLRPSTEAHSHSARQL